jgi:DNA-binding CsgD family transcriptional regulator
MAVKVFGENSVAAVLVVARGPGQGEFGQTDAKLLARLAPHLHRAVQMNRRLSLPRGATEGMADVLDRLPHGAMLVDAAARVLFANRAARSILAARDGLRSDPDGLRADTPAQTNDLRRRIGRAAAPAAGVEAPPGSLALARASGRRPLLALVTPAAGRGTARSKPAALVFVGDPELALAVPPERLRRLYGLTRAEAAVAVALLRGDDMRAVADGLGVTLATARTHLQRVFEKTGTRRQAELVSLLLGGAVATGG